MLWIILATLLVLGVTFYQAVQGVFSALIMALGTIVCVSIAFNYYEPLGAMISAAHPELAHPAALMGLLFVPLLAFRIVVDRFLPGNLIPGVVLDRAGGAIFGLVTALLLIGTLQIAMQMLPFERAILGYDPYTDTLKRNSRFPYADSFTLGMVETLSAGSMSAIGADETDAYGYHHENLILELWGLRNRTNRTSIAPGTEPPAVSGVYDVTDRYDDDLAGYPGYAGDASRILAVRVDVPDGAAERGVFHLSGTHFRLVDSEGESFFPMGYLQYAGGWQAVAPENAPGEVRVRYSADQNVAGVDLLYRLPMRGATPREPAFLQFRAARVTDVPEADPNETHPPITGALGGRQATGRIEFPGDAPNYIFRPEQATVNNDLPLRVSIDAPGGSVDEPTRVSIPSIGAEFRDSRLAAGELQGAQDELRNGDTEIRELWAPEGYQTVLVTGSGPESGMLPNLAQIALAPQAVVRMPDGRVRTVPAVGAWVAWREGQGSNRRASMHLFYEANTAVAAGDTSAEGYLEQSRSIEQSIRRVGETIRRRSDQGVDVAAVFLLPEGSVMQALRLGGQSLQGEAGLEVTD
jgi:uncharacterized membrane protein required for colicin V production